MKEKETKTQSKGAKILKVILNTIINILIVLILITSVLIAVMALTSKANGGISTIFGYTVQPIQSNSMKGGSPDGYGGKDFEKGDLMIAKATNSDAVYDMGDIVTFKEKTEDYQMMFKVHRIVDVVETREGKTVYQTWGDNRVDAEVPDQSSVETYITADDIVSVYYTKDYEGVIWKGVGSVLDFLQSREGFFFAVLLPMIIFFMYALIRMVLSASGYKKTKADEEKDEAVKAAVAEALAEKAKSDGSGDKESDSDTKSLDMSDEELEQFRQFQEFKKMQKAQKVAEQEAEPESEPEIEADDTPAEE